MNPVQSIFAVKFVNFGNFLKFLLICKFCLRQINLPISQETLNVSKVALIQAGVQVIAKKTGSEVLKT